MTQEVHICNSTLWELYFKCFVERVEKISPKHRLAYEEYIDNPSNEWVLCGIAVGKRQQPDALDWTTMQDEDVSISEVTCEACIFIHMKEQFKGQEKHE